MRVRERKKKEQTPKLHYYDSYVRDGCMYTRFVPLFLNIYIVCARLLTLVLEIHSTTNVYLYIHMRLYVYDVRLWKKGHRHQKFVCHTHAEGEKERNNALVAQNVRIRIFYAHAINFSMRGIYIHTEIQESAWMMTTTRILGKLNWQKFWV